jgi:hypothetical protein
MPLLLTLLVVAYIGSVWMAGRGPRSFGSPSGAEYVLLGVLLGPLALGALSNDALSSFQPLAHVGLSWISFGYGLEYGVLGDRRTRLVSVIAASFLAAITMLAAAACVMYVALALGEPFDMDLILLCVTIGLVSAETTRHAVRWVSERHLAQGPLSELVAEIAASDDGVVLIALATLLALFCKPASLLGVAFPAYGFALITLGLGSLLGIACAWLVGRTPRHVEWWTLMLGCTWFASGVATNLDQSGMAATFMLGLALNLFSVHAHELRTMFSRTEGAVLLPALVLAGAHARLPSVPLETILVAVALLARTLGAMMTGATIACVRKSTRPAAGWLGLGMLSSGTLTMMVGFALALRFEGRAGRLALIIAGLGTLLGELIGPFALRRALKRAGELNERDLTPAQGTEALTLKEPAP